MDEKPTLEDMIKIFKEKASEFENLEGHELFEELRTFAKASLEELHNEPRDLYKYVDILEEWHDLLSAKADYHEKLICFSTSDLESYMDSSYWQMIRTHHANDEKVEAGLVIARQAKKIGRLFAHINFKTVHEDINMVNECIEEALKKEPENVGLYLAMAEMGFLNANQRDSVLKIIKKPLARAIEIDPDCPYIYSWLGTCYEKIDQIEKAKENYQKAIELGCARAKYDLKDLEEEEERKKRIASLIRKEKGKNE